MAERCAADANVLAVWVGGSLASGTGDWFSDVDFRIAVTDGTVEQWAQPDWSRYLPIEPVGGIQLRFGTNNLLHHMVLADGVIVDFFIQETNPINTEPSVVVLYCADDELRMRIEALAQPAHSLATEIDAEGLTRFFVDYWILSHKQAKAISRHYDEFAYTGVSLERTALLRALYMEQTGKSMGAQFTLHVIGAMHKALADKLTERQLWALGAPTTQPTETVAAIEAIRTEMARIGRSLAEQYPFDYPFPLEEVVLRIWRDHKSDILMR
jgi:hypothetical protein